jgi:hypothetical protein
LTERFEETADAIGIGLLARGRGRDLSRLWRWRSLAFFPLGCFLSDPLKKADHQEDDDEDGVFPRDSGEVEHCWED